MKRSTKKLLMVGGVAAAAVIAYTLYKKSSASSSTGTGRPLAGTGAVVTAGNGQTVNAYLGDTLQYPYDLVTIDGAHYQWRSDNPSVVQPGTWGVSAGTAAGFGSTTLRLMSVNDKTGQATQTAAFTVNVISMSGGVPISGGGGSGGTYHPPGYKPPHALI